MLINQENIDPTTLASQLENWTSLRERALSYIQQSSAATWTDHNIHDPGITIMEALCYALADVGYRMNFGMADLMTDGQGLPATGISHSPADILPCRAVSIADYRKLLMDLPSIKNAWISPITDANSSTKLDYEPMYVYEQGGTLLLEHQLQALPGLSAAEKQAILQHKIFLKGLYALNVAFEPQLFLGHIDSGESFETVIMPGLFGDMYVDVSNWKQLVNNKLALKTIASAPSADRSIVLSINAKNKFNNSDGKLDQRVLSIWYFDIEIKIKNQHAFTLQQVMFECFLEGGKGISGKEIHSLLSQNNFAFFHNIFEKIRLLAQAYTDIETLLQAQRNLCEDFLPQIASIPTVDFRICADIDTDPKVDLEQIQAEIYLAVEQYLSPRPVFHSFDALQARGMSIEEILEGPLLKHGFLLESELGPNYYHTSNIYLSDIINALYEIQGIINVRNVQLNLIDENGKNIPNSNTWEILVPIGSQPVLNKRKSKFTFFKNGLPLLAHFKESILKYNMLNMSSIKLVNSPLPQGAKAGTYRDLALHYTLADEFPATYRIGKNLPDNYLNDAKYFSSKQLEGYLLHFDQLIANFLTDLEHLRQSLSWMPVAHLEHNSPTPAWRREYLLDQPVDTLWQNTVETEERFLEKRNRSLDFLLSRFAENLEELDNHYYLTIDNQSIDKKQYLSDLIALKQKFLANYVSISSQRGAAINYLESSSYFDTKPSGYEQRLAHLLGCELSQAGQRRRVAQVSKLPGERGYLHCLEHLMLRLPSLSTAHKQLISNKNIKIVLPGICTDDDCSACGGHDPYSFTASIALPGWLPLYADIQYRDYLEQLIRRETPVGVLLRICWIDEPSMQAYEEALDEWWGARHQYHHAPASNQMPAFEKLIKAYNKLILALRAFRSVYPPATLHGCEDETFEENNTRIFLGKTHLGEPKDFE